MEGDADQSLPDFPASGLADGCGVPACSQAARTGRGVRRESLAASMNPPPSTRSPSYRTSDCPGAMAETGSSSAISISSSSIRTISPRARERDG